MTLATQANTLAGTYPITITGTSGTLSHVASATIIVNASTSSAPYPVSVTPWSGSGTTQTFAFVADDPNGYADITFVQALFNGSLSGVNACYLLYDPSANVVYLKDDASTSWVGSTVLGVPGILENSACRLDAGASSSSGSVDNLTVNFALTFKPKLTGTQDIFMLVDSGNLNSGWYSPDNASWTVPVLPGALPSG